MAQLQLNALSADSNIPGLTSAVGDTGSMAAQIKAPTIIYASRTHSQISQVVQVKDLLLTLDTDILLARYNSFLKTFI